LLFTDNVVVPCFGAICEELITHRVFQGVFDNHSSILDTLQVPRIIRFAVLIFATAFDDGTENV